MSKTIRQHFIPRFLLRKWTDEKGNYNTYDFTNESRKSYNVNNYGNDPFHEKNFYELEEKFETNSIENKLAKLEKEFSQLIKKIETSESIELNRYETKFLRLYSIIDTYRSKAALERAIKKEGGKLFNLYYSQKTDKEIKIELLDALNYLINDVYEFNKNNVGLLPTELEKNIINKQKIIYENIKKRLPLEEIKKTIEIKNFKDRIESNIWDIYSANTKFIKIPLESKESFILTDSPLVEYYGDEFSQENRITILYLKILSPKLALAYMALDFDSLTNVSQFTKNSIWNRIFPYFFQKDNEVNFFNMKQILTDTKKNNIDLTNLTKPEQNLILRDVMQKNRSNKDQYKFKTYFLENSLQISLINAMNLSQTMRYVVYKDFNDLRSARKTIKEYKINRIEDRGL